MPVVRRARAFTLIETMIVVVVVGILALLATVSYRKWVRNSYMSEAANMLANIRMAEESFRAENGGYLQASPDLNTLYPAPAPAASFATEWGQPFASWPSLNVKPSGPVRFGYAVIAGTSAQTPPDVLVNGVSANYPSMAGQPWFIAKAVCDIDDDGAAPDTTIYAASGTNQLLFANEGR